MAQTEWRLNLTKEQADQLFLLTLEDDTDDALWMTMGDLQFWSASGSGVGAAAWRATSSGYASSVTLTPIRPYAVYSRLLIAVR